MSEWKCPYCDKPLASCSVACCGEVGHAAPEDDADHSVCQHGIGFDEDCDLCDETPDGWCPVCGGKDGDHKSGCQDGSEIP